ncbi:MAG: hypothetical protein IJ608_00695 [Lachnospiraceae bacterium]|nr:hypothetical protein [Lachnospiraceae bacterium]
MLFSSVEFILVFMPLFLIVYYLTPAKYKNYILLTGSLIFYAYGGLKDLALLLLSLIVNYSLSKCIGEWRKDSLGKIILTVSVILNVSVLGIYKYGGLILEALGRDGEHTITGFGSLSAMPLGLSFYTFQILSYLIDMYRGEVPQDVSFSKYAVYISMFPRLVQGPMFQYSRVGRALEGRHITIYDIQNGLKTFTIGLAAKVLLADRIGLLWRDIQVTGIVSISTGRAWLGMIAYSLQLYFDFCGYSIMAVGVGRMLGFELPANFDSPYMSKA